jgi:hypothetical protein
MGASMGPPSLDGGDDGRRADQGVAARASMGPPSLDGGDMLLPSAIYHRRCASMGPPSLDGGDAFKTASEGTPEYKLQWGRRLSTAETPPARRRARPAPSALTSISHVPEAAAGRLCTEPRNHVKERRNGSGTMVFAPRRHTAPLPPAPWPPTSAGRGQLRRCGRGARRR